MSWTVRGRLRDGTPYVVSWPGELPGELAELVHEAAAWGPALATPTGPTLLPPGDGEDDGGAWLLALLRERTRLERVTGRPPRWPIPRGAVG